MIIRTIPVTVVKRAGYDLYGKELKGVEKCEKCAVVKLIVKSQTTTVRVDSGATRHSADETVADVVLLLAAQTCADIDDLLHLQLVNVRVKTKRARFTVSGKLDHWEVGCEIE